MINTILLKFKSPIFVASVIYVLSGLIVIWLTVCLWLPEGYYVVGHDSGLALESGEFLKTRLYAWDERLGFGQDNTTHFGSLTLHSVDFLTSLFSGVPYAGNRLNFFFWTSLIFVSAFIFSFQLKNKLNHVFVFIFPVLMTVNFYILQSIFVLERAKYSVLVATLLFLAIIFRFQEKKKSVLFYSLISASVLSIFNSGSWLGLPLYGGLIVTIFTLIIFSLIFAFKEWNFHDFYKLILLLTITAVLFVALNSYSLLPYLNTFIYKDASKLQDQGIIQANLDWVNALSQSTSFINLFALQGIPDWYTGPYLPNPDHSYAKDYIAHPLFLSIGVLFSILAFVSLLIAKGKQQKKVVGFFLLLALTSMFFTAGTHPPLGFVYKFLYEYVPGFSIFRTPYYKFGGVYLLSFFVLISFTISEIILLIASRVKLQVVRTLVIVNSILLVLVLWAAYLNPFFSTEVFSWGRGLSTKVTVPDYVNEFSGWSKINKTKEGMILLLPPLNEEWRNDGYKWGYWSLSTLQYALTSQSILTNDSALSFEEHAWVNSLYESIRTRDEDGTIALASRLGVRSILLRKDINSPESWSGAESPLYFEEILNSFNRIKKNQIFEQWVLYDIEIDNTQKISIIPTLAQMPSENLNVNIDFAKRGHVFSDDINSSLKIELSKFINRKVYGYVCQSCILENGSFRLALPVLRILPGSPLYYFKDLRDKTATHVAESGSEKIDLYSGLLFRRLSEVNVALLLGVEDKYIISSLKTAGLYFDELMNLLESNSDPNSDFFRAKKLPDMFSSVEDEIQKYYLRPGFSLRSNELKDLLIKMLLQIVRLKAYYAPILNNVANWQREKIYTASIDEGREYDLLIFKPSLPVTNEKKVIMPESIIDHSTGETIKMQTVEENNNWISMHLPVQKQGISKLSLRFGDLPNLFILQGSSIEESPLGQLGCYFGRINNFKPEQRYNFKVSKLRKDEVVNMYFTENTSVSSKKTFIKGDPIIEVRQPIISEPFMYTYYSRKQAKDIKIFICNSNKDLPQINVLQVYQMISPIIVAKSEIQIANMNPPIISYKQIDSTKYVVRIENASSPFIIRLGERYDSSWSIHSAEQEHQNENFILKIIDSWRQMFWKNTDELAFSEKHFKVDNNTNGWLINKTGSYNLIIEFMPQRLFYIGLTISLIVFVVIMASIIYMTIMRIRK